MSMMQRPVHQPRKYSLHFQSGLTWAERGSQRLIFTEGDRRAEMTVVVGKQRPAPQNGPDVFGKKGGFLVRGLCSRGYPTRAA